MTSERVIAQKRAAFADKEAYSSAPPPAMKASFYSFTSTKDTVEKSICGLHKIKHIF